MTDVHAEFPTGAVVMLKVGGPLMMVEGPFRNDGMVCTHWFANGLLQRDTFDPVNLMKVADE